MSPGLLTAGETVLDSAFVLNDDTLPGRDNVDFIHLFEDCVAALIVEKCHLQPAQHWSQQTVGVIVLKALDALNCLRRPAPLPIKNLLLDATAIARQIVPAPRWEQAI